MEDPPTRFAQCDRDECNDRVIGIRASALLDVVRQRVLSEVASAVREYRDETPSYSPWIPWAADSSDPGSPGEPAECESSLWAGLLPAEEASPPADDWALCGNDPHLSDWIVDNGWNRYIFYKVADGCRGSAASCANAPSADLLTLDGMAGQAVIFGVPENISTVDYSATSFSNPESSGSAGSRFDAIAASES